ncbi:MAG: dephospho-CoA kinase [Rickettsiaceae bacterium]|nr:dephospho-CoA kinase [Rickettsiaceae bacterium]
MHNIAITGSFASGKSFVLELLQSMGCEVFSCDDYVKNIYEDLSVQKIVESSIEGLEKFNKKKLAEIIYNNPIARKILEDIVHPMVLRAIKEFERQNKDEDFIFTEVPLLFESGFDKYFLYSICVFCSEATREERSKSRSSFNPIIFEKIKKIQFSQDDKKNRANFAIDSEQKKEIIEKDLKEIMEKI